MSFNHSPSLDTCQTAIEAYRDALEDRCDGASVNYAAGRIWELIGQTNEALKAYLRALSEPSAKPWLFLLDAVVRCAKASARSQQVAIWLAKRANGSPPMPELGFLSGHLFRVVDLPEQACLILRECLPSISSERVHYWATRELTSALTTLGRLEEARQVISDAIHRHPAEENTLRNDLEGLSANCDGQEEVLAENE